MYDAASEYNGDDRNKINIQLSLSEGFNNTSTNPVSTLLPKTSVEYWNSNQAMGQEGSGVVSLPGSLGPNMNYHGPSSGGSSEYWIQVNYWMCIFLSLLIVILGKCSNIFCRFHEICQKLIFGIFPDLYFFLKSESLIL